MLQPQTCAARQIMTESSVGQTIPRSKPDHGATDAIYTGDARFHQLSNHVREALTLV